MKKILVCALIAFVGWSISTPEVSAQGRRGGRTESSHTSTGNIRGGAGSSASSSVATRPGTTTVKPGTSTGTRPGLTNGNNGNHNNNNGSSTVRPGQNNGNHNNGATTTRPGQTNNFRPGQTVNGNNHNNNGYRPGQSNNNGYRPGLSTPLRPGAARPTVMQRPYRPGLAPVRPFARPVPPTSWRPTVRVNLWTSILGIPVGMTINSAIDNLLYSGYSIEGYGSNEIYLTGVNQFNYYWPEATMYYQNGGLIGSRFYYSSLGYDMTRYRSVFSTLTDLYGAPVSMNSTADGYTATWYGTGNQYITLDFAPLLTDSGRRYFTTLSIGI